MLRLTPKQTSKLAKLLKENENKYNKDICDLFKLLANENIKFADKKAALDKIK